MKAEIASETTRYIVCPGCGYDRGFRIDHLDDCAQGHPFGSWTCGQCGVAIRGRTQSPGAEIEVVPGERVTPALVLLEIGTSEPPVFAVLEHSIYRPDEPGAWTDSLKFLFESHSCPTNFIECEAFLWDGDADPHGVLRFVQAVPRPEGYEDYGSWKEWAMVFDQLPGQIIEGARIMRTLPTLNREHGRQ